MSKIKWDETGKKLYETGVEHGVLYVQSSDDGTYPQGVAWNGLINISEKPSGGEPSPIYADNIKYLNLMSAEEFGASIEAYTYPDEFAECDGSKEIAPGVYAGQQTRKIFGMAYKTNIGNDIDGDAHGYKIHLIYGCLAAPSEKSYATINDNPEAITFNWEVSTTPVPVKDAKPTASIIIDSTKTTVEKMKAIEDILYGVDASADGTTQAQVARLPLPDEIVALLKDPSNG